MGKVRVLQFLLAKHRYGGRTQVILKYWKHIDRQKFEFEFVAIGEKLSYQQEIEDSGGKVHYLSCRAEENPLQFEKELEAVLKNNFDAIHIHTSFWKGFSVEKIAKKVGIPKIIIHSHNTSVSTIEDKALMQKMEETHYQLRGVLTPSMATDFWACSSLAADWLFGEQIPKEQVVIIKNAIEVDKFLFNQAIRDQCRRELGLENCFVIGHVGRFVYQKNHEFLLRVFAEVHRICANARLLLVGGGVLEANIRAQARELNVDDAVLFLGPRSDVHNLLFAADAFCMPSRFEGLPIALIEAQSAGLKCISSDAVTVEAKITNNLVFLPLVEELWIRTLLDIENGYERADMYEVITSAGYNIKNLVKELEKRYQS